MTKRKRRKFTGNFWQRHALEFWVSLGACIVWLVLFHLYMVSVGNIEQRNSERMSYFKDMKGDPLSINLIHSGQLQEFKYLMNKWSKDG